MINLDRKNHWETVYETKNPDQVSWTQEVPRTSLDFIASFGATKTAKIIDIGGGDSKLVDYLLDNGFVNITVLDISAKALEKAQKRLGDKAKNVNWVLSDIIEFGLIDIPALERLHLVPTTLQWDPIDRAQIPSVSLRERTLGHQQNINIRKNIFSPRKVIKRNFMTVKHPRTRPPRHAIACEIGESIRRKVQGVDRSITIGIGFIKINQRILNTGHISCIYFWILEINHNTRSRNILTPRPCARIKRICSPILTHPQLNLT